MHRWVLERARKRRYVVLALLLTSNWLIPNPVSAQPATSSNPTASQPTPSPTAPQPGPAPSPAAQPAPSPTEPAAAQTYADADPNALTDFRPTLDSYGSWKQHSTYGLVWVPYPAAAGADFAPYVTSGHWALTVDGDWTWVSDYPWGWVVFHYGRWVWLSGEGWAWIPGRRYAPAWVSWRVSNGDWDYVGWAPMAPTFVWFGGVAVALTVFPPEPFVFCHSSYIFAVHVRPYLVPPAHVHFAAAHTHRWYRPARAFRTGPPLVDARVPAVAVPRTRVRPDPRAMAASRPSPARRVPPRVGAFPTAPGSPISPRPSPGVSRQPVPRTPVQPTPRIAQPFPRRVQPSPRAAQPLPHPAQPMRAAPRIESHPRLPPPPFYTLPRRTPSYRIPSPAVRPKIVPPRSRAPARLR